MSRDNIEMDLKEEDARSCTGVIRFNVGFCEHGNEHSGSIKCGEFLGHQSNY